MLNVFNNYRSCCSDHNINFVVAISVFMRGGGDHDIVDDAENDLSVPLPSRNSEEKVEF